MGHQVSIHFEEPQYGVRCLSLTGHEEVGKASCFEIELSTEEVLDTQAVLGKAVSVEVDLGQSSRIFSGIATQVERIASKAAPGLRHRCRVQVESGVARLRYTQRSRIFQDRSLPDIAKQVLVDGGVAADRITSRLSETHPPVRYVVQYDESDAGFLRRLCERGGFYFYVEEGRDAEGEPQGIVLADDSTLQEPELPPLPVVDATQMVVGNLFARRLRLQGRLSVGKMTLRDYDHEKPALRLEGLAEAGLGCERSIESYEAPAGFGSREEGNALAKRRLEAVRSETRRLTFETNAIALTVGSCCELESVGEEVATAEGRFFIVGINHGFSIEQGYRLVVTAIPQKTPLRLPRVTPAPRIAGIHSAWVTGPEGEEIFTDELGRVRLHFAWDRGGPTNEKSSIPVRVAQPNTPQSMVIPRIGWEVWVAFEDGDPERPYVLGRCYNAKQPPPYALPANKAVTAIRSFSSPGSGAMNSIEFNDAAGAQGLTINAGFGKSTTVGGDLKTQTGKVEEKVVGAAQTLTVNGTEKLSIKQAYTVGAKTQIATVSGNQEVGVTGKFDVKVGSETVSIGGALLEQVGSPAAIAASLASAAALAAVSSKGAEKWLGKKGPLLGQAAQMGKGLYDAYAQGGADAAGAAAKTMAVGLVSGAVPGGDALVLGLKEKALGGRYPWEPPEGQAGPDAPAAATLSAKSAGGSAAAAGSGDKNQKVSGNVLEVVCAAHSVITPARMDWETAGGFGGLMVGTCQKTSCTGASLEVLGAASEKVGAHFVKAGGAAVRTVRSSCKTQCAALKMNSKGALTVKASTINLTCGPLGLKGSTVTFECGGSTVSFSGSGMAVKSGTIKILKTSKQSGDTDH